MASAKKNDSKSVPFEFLGLRRLGYVASPELPLVALSWARLSPQTVEKLVWPPDDAERRRIFRYESASMEPTKTFRVASTRPALGTAEFGRFCEALSKVTQGDRESALLATAFLDSLRGVGKESKRGTSALPVTFQSALLQDPAGLLGKAGPPDFAAAFEEFWVLGGGDRRTGALTLLSQAQDRLLRKGGAVRQVLSALDNALKQANVLGVYLQNESLRFSEPSESRMAVPAWWTPALQESSPFGWFVSSWTRLCSEKWVDALPPRRWVDWASSVFRMAVGMAYLWEARALGALVRSSRNGRYSENWIHDALRSPTLEWRDEGSVSARDVRGAMDAHISVGEQLRMAFSDADQVGLRAPQSLNARGLWDFLQKLTRGARFTSILAGNGPTNTSQKNLLETVRYALAKRRSSAEDSDQYGFIELRGARYWVPDPSTEWTAMVASLSAPGPTQTARLREVRRALRQLGIEVSVPTLTRKVEAAGLARGSSDAEQALLVSTAY
jgi:hypothetical protein